MSAAPNGVKLVIFDKDGTLVDFHRMWLPWASTTVQLLEEATSLPVGPSVYRTLGVDPIRGKVSMGALAEKNLAGIRADVSLTLQMHHGVPSHEADKIVVHGVPEAANGKTHPVCDLRELLLELRSMGIKSALCTADSRRATVQQMLDLGIHDLLDEVVCGNDPGIVPKPSPHCAMQICKRLNVELSEAIMVGDTIADLKMGRVAGMRASVAVLTGVGCRTTLAEYSDFFIDDASHLPHLIRNHMNDDTKRG